MNKAGCAFVSYCRKAKSVWICRGRRADGADHQNVSRLETLGRYRMDARVLAQGKARALLCWMPGGWDAGRRGVIEGVQHNTYDVEFYGPNPLCGIYYLGALRAAEEMARVVEDQETGATYRDLYDKGRRWIEANLFNGEYYIQQVRSMSRDQIAKSTMGDMGADHPETPEFQLGDGCLADQLIGQYLADIAGLGPLLDPDHIQKTLRAIYKYNYRKNLFDHDSVQRVYALNDESAVLVCDYGKGTRPQNPVPLFPGSVDWHGVSGRYAIPGLGNASRRVRSD